MHHLNANSSENWHIQTVSETGSTNADLMVSGAAGAPDRSVLRAQYQSAGRGRLDRTWEAPRGVNLLVSLLFRDVPDRLHVMTQVVALAAAQIASQNCGVDVQLKWPNDLLIGDKKVAGILAQAAPIDESGRIAFVVVGIGLNIGWSPPDAACLANSGWTHEVTPEEFLEIMLPEIDRLLSLSSEDLHDEYLSRVVTIGTQVRAEMPNGNHIVGRALTVEPDGRLVVLDDCAMTHRIDTADVVHLRPTSD